MRILPLPHPVPRSADVRFGVLGGVLVTASAAIGAALYTIEPLLLVLVALGAAGVVGLRAVFTLPGVVLAAYLCTPFYKVGLQAYMPVDVTVVLALLNILQLPIWLVSMSREGITPWRDKRVRHALILWSLLTGMVVTGIGRSPDTDGAIRMTTNWIALGFLPAFAVFRIASHKRYLHQLLWGLLAIGAAVVLAGLWTLPQVGEWPNDRLRVFGSHTIRVGQAALLVPLIVFPFALRSPNFLVRAVGLLLIPGSLLVAASSGSRGPILMLGITGMVFLARRVRKWAQAASHKSLRLYPMRFTMAGLVILLLIMSPIDGLVTRYIPETSANRLATLSTIASGLFGGQDLAAEGPDASTEVRVIAYDVAERMFYAQPLIGHGTYSFATEVVRHEVRLIYPDPAIHPHNLLLQVAAEHGLTGLALVMSILGISFWRGFRLSSSPEWTTITIIALFFFLCALVSTEMLDNRMLWTMMLLLMLAPPPGRETGFFREVAKGTGPSAPPGAGTSTTARTP